MEFIKIVAEETGRVAIGLYGLLVIVCVSNLISYLVDGMVNFIGVQANKYFKSKTR